MSNGYNNIEERLMAVHRRRNVRRATQNRVERKGKKWQNKLTPEEIKLACKFVLCAHNYSPEQLMKTPLGSLKPSDLDAIKSNINRLDWPHFKISDEERAMLNGIKNKVMFEIARRSECHKSSQQV